jgi:hypothetical protein
MFMFALVLMFMFLFMLMFMLMYMCMFIFMSVFIFHEHENRHGHRYYQVMVISIDTDTDIIMDIKGFGHRTADVDEKFYQITAIILDFPLFSPKIGSQISDSLRSSSPSGLGLSAHL